MGPDSRIRASTQHLPEIGTRIPRCSLACVYHILAVVSFALYVDIQARRQARRNTELLEERSQQILACSATLRWRSSTAFLEASSWKCLRRRDCQNHDRSVLRILPSRPREFEEIQALPTPPDPSRKHSKKRRRSGLGVLGTKNARRRLMGKSAATTSLSQTRRALGRRQRS